MKDENILNDVSSSTVPSKELLLQWAQKLEHPLLVIYISLSL